MQRVLETRNPALNLFGDGKHGFKAGNPATGEPATTPGVEFFNAIQEEICRVIEESGMALDPSNRGQLIEAVRQVSAEPFASHDPDKGAALIGIGGGRTQADKNAELLSISDCGAVAGQNCAAALIEAAEKTSGVIRVPAGEWTATFATAEQAAMADVLSRIVLDGNLTIRLPAGYFQYSAPMVFSVAGGHRLRIIGADPIPISITGQLSVTGIAGAYDVVLSVSSAAGISVGDYLHTTDVTGTGDKEQHRGGWKIIAVDAANSRITVRNTCRADAFPGNTITASTSYVIKTVLKFANCDGFVVRNSIVGYIDNLAVVGNSDEYWLAGNVAGTEKGTHGFVIGANTIALNGKTDNANQYGQSLAHVSCGPVVCVSDFDQQGIVTELGGSFYGNFVSSCNNKRRGFYASTASGIRAKHISANGNYLDGVIADIGGAVYCSSVSCAEGNGGSGFSAGGGTVIADSGIAKSNRVHGFSATVSGRMQATGSIAQHNMLQGYYGEYNSTVYNDNSTADSNGGTGCFMASQSVCRGTGLVVSNNGAYGLRSDEHSLIICTGVTNTGNTSGPTSLRNGGLVVDGSSYVAGPEVAEMFTSKSLSTGKGVRFATTSGGDDAVIQHDTAGTGSFTTKFHLRSGTGGFYAHTDNDTPCGRVTERWSVINAGTGVINTSDGREKTKPLPINDTVLDAWSGVQLITFQWLEMIQQKGEDIARLHFGVIAQQVRDAFAAHGLDGTRYGLLCYDEWEDEYEPVLVERNNPDTGELELIDTGELRLVRAAGNRWGIRADQCLFLEAAYQRRRLDRLEARLSALEAV